MFAKGFATLFPQFLIADSRHGARTIDDFQSHVARGLQQLSETPDEFAQIQNLVFQQFSIVDRLESAFLEDSEKLMFFASKEDASELVRIVSLDVKKAILDSALDAIMSQINYSDQDTTDSNSPSDYSPSTKPRRRRPNLPIYAKDILSCWFRDHVDHPYPTQAEKLELSERTGLNLQKVDNWFINERSRKWHSYRRK